MTPQGESFWELCSKNCAIFFQVDRAKQGENTESKQLKKEEIHQDEAGNSAHVIEAKTEFISKKLKVESFENDVSLWFLQL